MGIDRQVLRSGVIVGWLSLLMAARADAAAGQDTQPADSVDPARTVLRMARSKDGMAFRDAGVVLLRGACAPSLVCLPNGHVLAVFDYAAGASKSSAGLAVLRSSDAGRSWLPPRPIRFTPAMASEPRVRHGCLVLMSDKLARLYFVASEATGDAKADRDAVVLSAVTGNGLDYRLDSEVRVPLPRGEDVRVTAVRTRSRIDLYADTPGTAAEKPDASRSGRRFASPDGRRFRPVGAVRGSKLRLVGSVLPERKGLRAYVSATDGIHSLISDDGIDWKPEPGVRLPNGWDPAVARLQDDTYLMLYCAPLDRESANAPQLAMGSTAGSGTDGADSPASAWESFASGDGAETSDGQALPPSAAPAGFAPSPDLQNRVDYVSWLEQSVLVPLEQNASVSYGTLVDDYRQSRDLVDQMYKGWSALGPPAPWSPADHPEWEASYQASQGLVAQFRAGCQDPRSYSTPALWPQDKPPEDRLLCEWLLPSVAAFRGMTKAMLSQAWRTENGVVPPEQMRDALQTCLGNVNHLQQAATLIERLVGYGERALVEENARWALHRNVFASPEDLEATLNVLRERDVPEPDPAGWLRTEHAMALDAIQYLFAADTPAEEPQLRRDRLERLAGMTGTQGLEHFYKLTPDDAKAAIECLNNFYQQAAEAWKGGYLAVKAAQPDVLAERMYEQHALAALTLPSLNRASVIRARNEASRRATQLSYAVQLFKARNGRWPASLEELPPEQDAPVRTDPFTGGSFGYRLTQSGPTIYTAGENGRDDGGVHSRTWGSGASGESDDYVFWPPQSGN